MKRMIVLTPENLPGLEMGQQIYITTWVAQDVLFSETPAMTVGQEDGYFVFIYIGEDASAKKGYLPLAQFGKTWTAMIEDGFTVNTPDGVLHASSSRDLEYPGITIDLYREGYEDYPIRLSMTEYSSGGEGLCGFDPHNPALSKREIAEVPVERIVTEDGKPIATKDGITYENAGQYHVTAGLVSRAWQSDFEDEDNHHRVFHTGYRG